MHLVIDLEDTGHLARIRFLIRDRDAKYPALIDEILGAVTASHLAEGRNPAAELWSAATKAHGIDTANSATAELALLLGASGFRADRRQDLRDLSGLLYADGIHDSPYRTAGRQHATTKDVSGAITAVPAPRDRSAQVAMTA